MTYSISRCLLGPAAVALMLIGPDVFGATLPPMLRGGRAILLRPDPGPLTIRIYKRDLNIYEGADELVARLFDPQRQEVATLKLPDDGSAEQSGRANELQSGEIKVNCEAPGIYRLGIACGGDLVFGLETSCVHCVVEGPLMLNDGSIYSRPWFMPPPGAFQVTAQALHEPGRQKLPLLDARGQAVHVFDLTKPGEDLVFQVPADVGTRDGLWRFEIEKSDVKLQLQKVTYWTAERSAYFPADKMHWMLLPRHTTRYLQPGETALIETALRNRTGKAAHFALELKHDSGLECRLVEPGSPVALEKNGQQVVRVAVRVPEQAKPGSTLSAHLTAVAVRNPEVAQSAGLEVRVGPSPVSRNLKLPIVLQRYRHENVQFGYAPDYVANEVYFDRHNRPFIRERKESVYYSTAITLLDGSRWLVRPFLPALQQIYPGCRSGYGSGGFLGAKIAFDGQNDAYTLLRIAKADKTSVSVLLHTPDDGRTYDVHELPGGAFDLEQFTGHNALDIPPPVLAYVKTADHPARFCAFHDLLLYLPQKQKGKLTLGEPVKVSDRCLGSCQHSGGPASTATRNGKTHIVWGEVTDDKDPGVPTYIATYDHASGKLGKPVFLAYAPPVNDVHNVPAVCQDSQGYIHVVAGAHGRAFQYLRSLRPNDAYGGWTEPVEVLSAGYVDDSTDADGDGRQTYISLVCDPRDTLHIAFRQWRRNVDEYHPGRIYAALSVQSKPRDHPWGPARPVVIPPVPGYSIYYHKLTIDRRGRLFLSYSYWTSDQSYQSDFPDRYHHRAVLVSNDGGRHWKLAETRDFAEGIL